MTMVKDIYKPELEAQGILSSFSFVDFITLYFQIIKFIVNIFWLEYYKKD